ncbi:hypothetical protein LWI29_013277 [Acer saccharum]|uniref:MULE transposase domain-containing protein n=1 Tax=Acer saccharum TaxID=4024 RepID=A0AA39RHH8_ACESA|nr:hypothetical protein LWI29_013277 [Acer saccharum]
MNIDSKIGSTSKSNYDLNTTSSSQWEYTNKTLNKYTYCGHSYNNDDQEAVVDPSFLTNHTPSTQHLCAPDNTTTLEVEPTLSELDDPAKLTSLQPSDVIGKEFASVQDAEAFYKNYSLFVGFSIRKDEMRSDRHGMITIHSKSVMDPEFFFDYTLDEDNQFGNLFRADSTSSFDYAFFGDVLAFDAMYRTNIYWRPLVMLVGVNHHHSTTIFGFGLLGDETVETYTWLLQTFLVAMHSKMPKSVVTDGDKAMHKAIKTVMTESVRRLCCWHLERNVQTNV